MKESTARLRRWRVGVIAVLVAAVAGHLYLQLPRYQVADRTIGLLGHTIQLFVEEKGRMPSGFTELEQTGYITRNDSSYWPSHPQIAIARPLLQLEDIVVDWQVDAANLMVRSDELVSRDNGARVYIVRLGNAFLLAWFLEPNSSMRWSKHIYKAMSIAAEDEAP